jgi:hypothetical protein
LTLGVGTQWLETIGSCGALPNLGINYLVIRETST